MNNTAYPLSTLDLQQSSSPLPHKRITSEENRMIANDKIRLLLLQMLSENKIAKILRGNSEGNFFVGRDYMIVLKNHIQNLCDIESFMMQNKFMDDCHKNIITTKEVVYKLRNKFNNISHIIDEFDNEDVINVSKINNDTNSSQNLQESYTPVRSSITTNKIPSIINNLEMINNRIISYNDFTMEYKKLIHSNGIYHSFASSYIKPAINEKDCLNCNIFLQFFTEKTICVHYNCPFYYNYQIYISDESYTSKAIEVIYAEQEGLTLESAYKQLQCILGINTELPYEEISTISNSNWYQIQTIKNPPPALHNQFFIPFYGELNNILGYCAIYYDPLSKAILPLTAWSYGNEQNEYLLHIPFKKPYPLYNLNLIKIYQFANIVISDSIEIAYTESKKSDKSTIYTSWLGGLEAINDVNWSPLINRNVAIRLKQHSACTKNKIYEISIALIAKLEQIENVNLIIEDEL